MRKKILSSIMVVFAAVLLVACSGKSNADKAVASAKDTLAIQDRATRNFEVPAKSGDVVITWTSNNEAALKVGETKNDKTTIEVTNLEEDTKVKLEATLTLKKSVDKKEFTVTVISLENLSNYNAELALKSLEIPGKTAANLTLVNQVGPVDITWTTSNEDVMTNTGAVNRSTKNATVKLIATAVDDTDTFTREFWVQVRGTEVDLDGTYKSSYGEIVTLNPLMSEGSADSDVYELLTDTLFTGDYDWEDAIANGYADFPGDFSKIKSDRNPNGTVDMPSIKYKRTLRMASAYPYAVNAKTDNAIPGSYGQLLDQDLAKETLDDVWTITLRDDLKFTDGTKIDTSVIEYSFKAYLDGKVQNARANYLYTEDYVPLVNGKEYFDGDVSWEDVGFEIVDDLTFKITLTKLQTQYSLMGSLSIINLVHPASYERGFNEAKTATNYGSVANPLVSYGPFTLKNDYEDTNKFEFTRNDGHYASWDVPYKHIDGPIIVNQTTIINEFQSEKLDVAGVGGEFWDQFKDHPNLYIAPSNSFYRLAISIERPEGRSNPAMANDDFRRALYLATDRKEFADTVQPPSQGALGYLSNIHQVTEWASQAYASSAKFGQNLEALGLSPETGGFNSNEAKRLFDLARADLIANEKLGTNEVIKIEYLYYDAGSNTRIANWVKATYESVFNTGEANPVFEVVLKAVSSDELTAQRNAGDFDLVFTGMSGATFQATFGMGYIFSPTFSGFLVGKGHDVPNLAVTADISNLLFLIDDKTPYDETLEDDEGIIEELPEGMRTKSEQKFFDLLDPTDGVFTGKFDELFNLYSSTPELDVDYEGQEEDLTNITAALEGALLEQMIAVPLFSSTSAAVYSNRVVREAHAYHLFLGWGGMSYTYLKK